VKTIVLFCASLLPWRLNAQVPFEVCQDRQGNPIAGVVDNTTPYAGIATEQNGRPVILWNQRSNAVLSRTEQIFIYLHECAHLTLGISTANPTLRPSSWKPTAGPYSSWLTGE
jgi:hypothetical protein